LGPYLGRQRLRTLLAVLAVLPDPLLMVGLPILLQFVIDRAIAPGQPGRALPLLLLPCLWLLIAVACNGAQVLLFAAIGGQLATDFRQRLFAHLLTASTGESGSDQAAEQALLAQQIPTLENTVVVQLPLYIWTLTQLILGVLLLLYTDWRLAFVAVLLTPLLLLSQVAFTPALARREGQRQATAADLLGFAAERLRSRELVDLFGLGASTRTEFARRNLQLMRGGRLVGTVTGLQNAALSASAMLTLVSVFALGTWLVLQKELSVGQLVSALGIATALVSGMWQLGPLMLPLQAASTALDLLERQLPPEAQRGRTRSSDLPAPPPLGQSLQLLNVHYRYPDGGGLENLSLRLAAGSSLALVGPSGGGKSTVLKMLLRQLEPQQGSLLLDGCPLAQFGRDAWLRQVALVPQDPVLFDLSIAENIRLGRLDATEAEVAAAASAAELDGLLESLPEGLQTEVGQGGGRLSGGQRQRIAIARAILREPQLLLLDEATSALDPATEAAINSTLARIAKGRTLVAVLHRLRAAASMDQVAVIADGQLTELGHHNELLAAGGLYAAFWHRQMSGFDLSDGQRARITPERLATIPLFHGVEPELLRWLADAFASDRVRPGEEVFREGDPPDSFYVVVAGTLEMLQADLWGGLPVKQGVLEDGDFFGDAGLLEDRPRAVTVRSRGDGLLLRLDRDRFLDLLQKDPDYKRFFRHSARANV
jgi:ATP-binding cassette subfamily B protein